LWQAASISSAAPASAILNRTSRGPAARAHLEPLVSIREGEITM
jgi:hypothetical protein